MAFRPYMGVLLSKLSAPLVGDYVCTNVQYTLVNGYSWHANELQYNMAHMEYIWRSSSCAIATATKAVAKRFVAMMICLTILVYPRGGIFFGASI